MSHVVTNASAAQNGWMSRNEIRSKENAPPVPGGDELTVQSNLMLLSKIGDVQPSRDAPSPERNALVPATTSPNIPG